AAQEAAANELIAAENPVQPEPQQSSEPQQIEVPGVIGQHVDAAAQTVAAAGLAYATSEVESAEPAGTVVETDPAAGTPLNPGAVVTLYYSSGPAQQTQPPATQQPGGSTTQPVTGGGSCGDTFGGVQPHVAEAGCILKAQFGYTIYGLRPGDPGDHGKGLALDVMVSGPAGYDVAEFALANFSVSYVIYEQQIRFPGGGWQPMEDRGDPTQNHFDHVHISFNP
ncbi:MAG: PASTA domain-containing protein, partial [Actinomycetota bacterium]